MLSKRNAKLLDSLFRESIFYKRYNTHSKTHTFNTQKNNIIQKINKEESNTPYNSSFGYTKKNETQDIILKNTKNE